MIATLYGIPLLHIPVCIIPCLVVACVFHIYSQANLKALSIPILITFSSSTALSVNSTAPFSRLKFKRYIQSVLSRSSSNRQNTSCSGAEKALV